MKRRNTPAREAVLGILGLSRKALSQEAVEQQLRLDVDRATIYRVLKRGCDDGVLHRVVAEDGKQYFAVCRGCEPDRHSDAHFHFRCDRCQGIECLNVPVRFSLPAGYQVTHVNCVLSGTCRDCV